jgi:hypothetical protein
MSSCPGIRVCLGASRSVQKVDPELGILSMVGRRIGTSRDRFGHALLGESWVDSTLLKLQTSRSDPRIVLAVDPESASPSSNNTA